MNIVEEVNPGHSRNRNVRKLERRIYTGLYNLYRIYLQGPMLSDILMTMISSSLMDSYTLIY